MPLKQPVAASCATCHAKEYCTTCHVDAPETRAIQALASDPRSLLIPASLASPASHARPDFVENHRKDVGKDAAACQTCHTQESCLQCHVGQPKAARALYAAEGFEQIAVRRAYYPAGDTREDALLLRLQL